VYALNPVDSKEPPPTFVFTLLPRESHVFSLFAFWLPVLCVFTRPSGASHACEPGPSFDASGSFHRLNIQVGYSNVLV
jgi:hypothetical protein